MLSDIISFRFYIHYYNAYDTHSNNKHPIYLEFKVVILRMYSGLSGSAEDVNNGSAEDVNNGSISSNKM